MKPELPDAPVVVLVEGPSDRAAVLAALAGDPIAGAAVVSMGGATSIGHHLDVLRHRTPRPTVLVLCDEAEVAVVSRICRDRWRDPVDDRPWPMPPLSVCRPDLESELITAVGLARVLELIDHQGHGPALRRLQDQPAHRGGDPHQQVRRFFGSGSGRKIGYAGLLTAALPAGSRPTPLEQVITAARRAAARSRSEAPEALG